MAIKPGELDKMIADEITPLADTLEGIIDEYLRTLPNLDEDGSFIFKSGGRQINPRVVPILRERYGGPDGWKINFDPAEPCVLEFVPVVPKAITGRMDR